MYPITTIIPMTEEFKREREENLKNVIGFKTETRKEGSSIIIEKIPIYK